MPARSNEFQKLVFLVKSTVAPFGATVTESKMLVDRETGDEREVDVCIQAEVAGHSVTLSIECRDHKRQTDITWVEQMLSKHQRLPTNSLILASRSGFSKRARTLALLKGIDLLVYESVDGAELAQALNLSEEVWAATFELKVTHVIGVVPATGELPEERVGFSADNIFFDSDGRRVATAGSFVATVLRSDAVVDAIQSDTDPTHRFFTVELGGPHAGNGGPLFVEKIEPRLMRRLTEVIVTGTCRVARARVTLAHGKLGPVRVAWGAARLGDRNTMIVAMQEANSSPIVTMHLTEPAVATTAAGATVKRE
jgi:hypothetical protein